MPRNGQAVTPVLEGTTFRSEKNHLFPDPSVEPANRGSVLEVCFVTITCLLGTGLIPTAYFTQPPQKPLNDNFLSLITRAGHIQVSSSIISINIFITLNLNSCA